MTIIPPSRRHGRRRPFIHRLPRPLSSMARISSFTNPNSIRINRKNRSVPKVGAKFRGPVISSHFTLQPNKAGRGGEIRTLRPTGSKPVALPLSYSPLEYNSPPSSRHIDYKQCFSFTEHTKKCPFQQTKWCRPSDSNREQRAFETPDSAIGLERHIWCWRWESNPHGLPTRDFKSPAYTIPATPAKFGAAGRA